ncbi:AraC family transcriptional regulator [Streptomyces sp. NRRL S-31]|uniref:AraC-like ligand-binding domain-containing protein n=1 Tax=Streptomyces sp. NRRL S-31 TaxID=1463898 RepID=UPI0007C7CC05|nr:AraC family transcriptional regulator [Streptomyces sp. NRRL S-31]
MSSHSTTLDPALPDSLHTTDSVPVQRRRAYWREALSQTFGAVDMRVPDEVDRGTIQTSLLGPMQVVTVDGEPLRAARTRRLIAAGDNDDYVVVKLLSRGVGRIEQDGRDAVLEPGQLFVYDMARPLQLTLPERFRTKSLVLPREVLGLSESDLQRITAAPLGSESGLGALLTPFLSRLVDTASTYPQRTGESIARNVVDLVQCRRDLARRHAAGLTIAAIAHRWGFISASHFSRVFRATYGVSPVEWRDSPAFGAV